MDRVKNLLIVILERLVGVLLMIMTTVTLAQVFCRYVLGFSLSWSHELVILVAIWTVWLCVPVGFDRVEHMSVTFFVNYNSRLGKFRMAWFHCALSIFFLGLVFILLFPVLEAFEGMRLLSIPVPINVRFYSAMTGSFLALFVLVVKLLKLIKED